MSEFTTTEWFNNILWATYPRGLCNRIGSKSKALLAAKSKIKSETDAHILIAGLREQIRYYQKLKKTGAHESEWKLPMLSTWLNGERWTDEIPSHYELKQKQHTEKCECGEKTDVGNLCWGCYCKSTGTEDWREKRIWDYFIKNNLAQQPGEDRMVWIQRLKTRAREGLRQIG